MDVAKKGQEVCVKIEPIPGESPKMYGRHFEATDILVSKVSRRGQSSEVKRAVGLSLELDDVMSLSACLALLSLLG